MHASSNPLIPATPADAAWYAGHGLLQQFDPAGALASTTQLRALLDAEAPLHCAEERARREDIPVHEVLDLETLEDLAGSTVGHAEAERIISLFA